MDKAEIVKPRALESKASAPNAGRPEQAVSIPRSFARLATTALAMTPVEIL
jgi:hypothetical protein